MKINNKKIIVSTLALAMGAALAGSISGSVAWYQYSTRAAAQIAGVSAGTSRNLQIAEKPASGQPAWTNKVSFAAKNFRPVSAVANAAGDAVDHFVEHPVYQYEELPELDEADNEQTANGITTVGYAEYELVFRVVDTYGKDNGDVAYAAKNVYLSYFEIEYTDEESKDIAPAIRIAIDGNNDFLVSKDGGVTTTHGQLDIGGAEGDDTDYWDCQDDAALVTSGDAEYVPYSNDGTDTSAYTTVECADVKADVDDAYDIESVAANADLDLATTTTAGSSNTLKIQVWLEGWQPLGAAGAEKTIWSKDYIEQHFSINMQFACEADQQ